MSALSRPRLMRRGLFPIFIFLVTSFCSLHVRSEGRPGDAVTPLDLVADPPTFHCLGFRWLVSGDHNGDASVRVTYRKKGDAVWQQGLPMLRVNREVTDRDGTPYTAGNLLAGSLFGLTSGTTYEVRFVLTDPDGGSADRTLTLATRTDQRKPVGTARTIRVAPDADPTHKMESGSVRLSDAIKLAEPGDHVVVTAGRYRGPLLFTRSGTESRPIWLQGEPGAIIEGEDGGTVIDVSARSHVWITDLNIRRGRTGIRAKGARSLVVRGCRIEDVNSGIISNSPDAAEWQVLDNEITGRVENWYPRRDSSDTGISCAGRGHIVSHNRVRRFWDCISTQNYGPPKAEWANALQPPQVGIEISRNDCSEALDDGIEADGALYNIRVFANRIMNVHSGITAQPNLGGPLYLVRNVVFNTTNTPLKLHNYPTGVVAYHNTLVSAGQAFQSFPPAWQNTTFRNNLFLGGQGYAMETGSPDRRTTLDYNGYRRGTGTELLIKWSSDGGRSWVRFAALADFARAAGHEVHGVMIDYDHLVLAAPPSEGRTYPPSDVDLRLRAGAAAVDAGCRIPTINDGLRGMAPDIGAYEADQPTVTYGPRRVHHK